MLTKITLLSSLIFTSIYPLCFWISYKEPLKNGFHRFHLGLPTIVGGITLAFILPMNFSDFLKIQIFVWETILLIVCLYYWKKDYPHCLVVTLPSLFGILIFLQFQSLWLKTTFESIFISILSGTIFCSALYAMNLGHWYLNVHGLPINHLRRAASVFWILVTARFLWDLIYIFTRKIWFAEEEIAVYKFLFSLDGFLANLGILFGTLFPLISLYFVKETIKLKNTQASTGILYVILCAVIIGEMTYRYYLLKMGVCL